MKASGRKAFRSKWAEMKRIEDSWFRILNKSAPGRKDVRVPVVVGQDLEVGLPG